ncbi:MAG: T9SS type A sorting domain-containing protein [Bacteroidales bacterium]|nr:T9SS type A sorting domain-containing protein [Bacteroidales bacterium]
MLSITFPAHAQFSGGNGSADNPYIITTAQQLAQLATFVNDGNSDYRSAYYKLGNDIDLSAYQSGTGWTPIGHDLSFYGKFDGNNKKITGLYINNPTLRYVGLFGIISGATVKNLAVENVNITGKNGVGSVVGTAYFNATNTITNCYSTGKVSGSGNEIGGIVGYFYGNLTNCYSTCEVSGNETVGGVAGIVSGSLKNCYSTGKVSGEKRIGGVSNSAYVGSNNISNCAALNPSVKGTNSDAGRIGIDGSVEGYAWLSLSNNAAYDGLVNNSGNTVWNNKGADKEDGEDITLQQIQSDGTIGGRFTAADGWTTENGKLPGLFGNTVPMPAHLGGVGIVETRLIASLQVYPNPTTGELTIEISDMRYEISDIEIYDVFGRKQISNLKSQISNPIDVSHLPSGIYFIRITTENGVITKKVIKN